MNLAFYTTEQLIKELARRTTFAGIIIHSPREVKEINAEHQNWDLDFQNLSLEQIHTILSEITEQINKKYHFN